MILAFVGFAVGVLLTAAYLYFKPDRECSPDGYVLAYGAPVYQGGLPLRCKRLPFEGN
ncbi:MAG: hypothetical protein IPL86_16045 [Flavobacteriales bacterium]|nr:hypothetical protein [Flavobacteriales bacterium]